jgi:hypothetical protein
MTFAIVSEKGLYSVLWVEVGMSSLANVCNLLLSFAILLQ